jgi:adenylate cyclase
MCVAKNKLILIHSFIQICINTLCVRHLIHPFRPGNKLKEHAMPMSEVIQQLQTQLAEFAFLKQQLSLESVKLSQLAPPLTANAPT